MSTSRRHDNLSGASTYTPAGCDEYAFRSYLAANNLSRNSTFHPPERPVSFPGTKSSSSLSNSSPQRPSLCQRRPALAPAPSTWRSSFFGSSVGSRSSTSWLSRSSFTVNRASTSFSSTSSTLFAAPVDGTPTPSLPSKPSRSCSSSVPSGIINRAKHRLLENKFYQPPKDTMFAQDSLEVWYARLAEITGEPAYAQREARQKVYELRAEETRLERYREMLWEKDAQ